MKVLVVLFCCVALSGYAQFTPVYTINSNYSGFQVKSFQVNEGGNMLLITRPYNGGPITDLQVYTSNNFGQMFDSTFFPNRSMTSYNSFVTDGGLYYFSSIVNVPSTTNPPGLQYKKVHRSLDFGASWQEAVVDSLNGSLIENALKFLNDSTGMFSYYNGQYVTTDYGQTWQKVYGKNAEHMGLLDNRFVFYTFEDAFTYNPLTSELDSMEYLPYCAGNVDVSAFHNGVSYRMMYAHDGQQQGYSTTPSNYAGFNIDALPLGDQKVIHFPQRAALIDIEVTDNCIHLVLDGRYARSCDSGNTFYDVDAFNGNMNEEVLLLEFVNDTLGFLISRNLITNAYRLWKTTNGGGSNGAQILTNIFYANVEELEKEQQVLVYPNPNSGSFHIQAESIIQNVTLFSADGRVCLEREVNSTELELNATHLAKGSYFVHISTSKGQLVKKVMVK